MVVHVGAIHDPDREDGDDTIANLKAAAILALRSNKEEPVEIHYIMDCGARMDYFMHVIGWMLDGNEIPDANARFIFYGVSITDVERIEEVKNRMCSALHRGADLNINHTNFEMLHIDRFPWGKLAALIIAAPQYGIPMQNISKMPPGADVYFVGDRNSVNARGFDFDKMQDACTIYESDGEHTIESRLRCFPPIDPSSQAGMTRQCLTSGGWVDNFCLLGDTGKSAFADVAEGLIDSTRRTIVDRPGNERDATIFEGDEGSHVDIKEGRVFLTSANETLERPVQWGNQIPPTVSGVIESVDNRPGGLVVLSNGKQFVRPDGKGLRRRLNLSNELTMENVNDKLKPHNSFTIRVEGHSTTTRSARSLGSAVQSILEVITDHEVYIDSFKGSFPLSKRIGSYSETYMGYTLCPDNSAVCLPEWKAVIYNVLSTLILFGDVFTQGPSLTMDKAHRQAVIAKLIRGVPGCDGNLSETTPNYDSAVVDAAFRSCLDGKKITDTLSFQKDQKGHVIVCHQDESVIEGYKSRDEQHIQYVRKMAVAYKESIH